MKLPVGILAIGFLAPSALALSAGHGFADTHVLARTGAWQAFGGTTEDGQPVCGMSSSGGGKYFGLKYYSGDNTLTIQLGNDSWTLKNKIKVKVRMQFDNNSPWNATGVGMHFSDGDAGLQFEINRKQLDGFMREFSNADHISISFPDQDVSDWHGSLEGSDTISRHFSDCMQKM